MSCSGYQNWISRQNLLVGAGSLLAGTALAGLGFAADPNRQGNIVVIVFMRGGADGLNILVPVHEALYYDSRPTTAIAQKEAIDLDGFFALHPKLSGLRDSWDEGELAAIHAIGSFDTTRSHFEAMAAMEAGQTAQNAGGSGSGWVARYLSDTARTDDSPLRSIAIGSVMPDSLRGGGHAVALERLEDFRIDAGPFNESEIRRSLASQFRGADAVSKAGSDTLNVLKALQSIASDRSEAPYPASELGEGLKQVARLCKADVGLEVACLDSEGWDTHVVQGGSTGNHATLLQDVGDSLAAFRKDLGPPGNRVTTIVMTEFGRRVAENTGLGTDHGRGGVMFVLGGGVQGKKVYGKWPGLTKEILEGPGDLPVTTDYRMVLAEVIEKRLRPTRMNQVFDGLGAKRIGALS